MSIEGISVAANALQAVALIEKNQEITQLKLQVENLKARAQTKAATITQVTTELMATRNQLTRRLDENERTIRLVREQERERVLLAVSIGRLFHDMATWCALLPNDDVLIITRLPF